MIELRKSNPEEVPELQELFQLCFGDGPEVSGLYFDHFYHPEEFLVLREEGQLRAMAGLLRLTLTEPDGRRVNAAYLYGMGTHPEHQGRGFAGQLLNYADFYLRGRADCIVTMPATAGLHSFYAKFGFAECFPLLEGAVNSGRCEGARQVDAAEYDVLREKLLAGRFHVSYGALAGLQDKLSRFSGGALLACGPGCAAAEHWNGATVIKELLCPPGEEEACLAMAAAAVPGERYVLRLPGWSENSFGLARKDFGMVKWYDPIAAKRWAGADAPYLGLAFD